MLANSMEPKTQDINPYHAEFLVKEILHFYISKKTTNSFNCCETTGNFV
jgi:hypothetical protein